MPRGAWRLGAAAALCFLALGMAWRTSLDFGPRLGYTLPYSYMGADGYHYTQPGYSYTYFGADGVEVVRGFQADERVVLVPAAVVLAWAAFRRSALSRRLARAAVVGLVALLAIAFSRGRVPAVVSMLAALWLAVPVVCPEWAQRLSRHRSGPAPPPMPAGSSGRSPGSAF